MKRNAVCRVPIHGVLSSTLSSLRRHIGRRRGGSGRGAAVVGLAALTVPLATASAAGLWSLTGSLRQPPSPRTAVTRHTTPAASQRGGAAPTDVAPVTGCGACAAAPERQTPVTVTSLPATPPSAAAQCTLVSAGMKSTGSCSSIQDTPPNFSGPAFMPDQPLDAFGDDPVAQRDVSVAYDRDHQPYVAEPSLATAGPLATSSLVGATTPGPAAFVFRSDDGGRAFQTLPAPADVIDQDRGFGGGYVATAAGDDGAVLVDTSWSDNESMSVSTDQGRTWTGFPWAHPVPLASSARSWMAADPGGGDVYEVWQSGNSGPIHVGRALLHAQLQGTPYAPASQLVFTQDVVAVPASIPQNQPAYLGPGEVYAGPVTVDSQGDVWFAYLQQPHGGAGGVGIAESTDGGLIWTLTTIPGSGTGGLSTLVYGGYPVVTVDASGNAYAVWSEAVDAKGLDFRTYFSRLPAGGASWHLPILASVSTVALLATAVAVAPGVVDIAYYGADSGQEEDAGGFPVYAGSWNLYVGQSSDALGAAHFRTDVARKTVFLGNPVCVNVTGVCNNPLLSALAQLGPPALGVALGGMVDVAAPSVDFSHLHCPLRGRCTGIRGQSMAFFRQLGPVTGTAGTTAGLDGGVAGRPTAGLSSPGQPYRFPTAALPVNRASTVPGAAPATQATTGATSVSGETLARRRPPVALPSLHAVPSGGGSPWAPALITAALCAAALGCLVTVGRVAVR